MRRVLSNDDHAVGRLGDDVVLMDLRAGRPKRGLLALVRLGNVFGGVMACGERLLHVGKARRLSLIGGTPRRRAGAVHLIDAGAVLWLRTEGAERGLRHG